MFVTRSLNNVAKNHPRVRLTSPYESTPNKISWTKSKLNWEEIMVWTKTVKIPNAEIRAAIVNNNRASWREQSVVCLPFNLAYKWHSYSSITLTVTLICVFFLQWRFRLRRNNLRGERLPCFTLSTVVFFPKEFHLYNPFQFFFQPVLWQRPTMRQSS